MSKTAGIIIIGDEVLNGSIIDTNSPFLCKQFHSLGIRVCKITTIPDNVEVIATEVRKFSESFDIVITTGGVGPTPDDVTYEGVASAFKVLLKVDEQFKKFYGTYLKSADSTATKLITIPSMADVIFATNLERKLDGCDFFPVVKMQNVFCLPGIPLYMETIFRSLALTYFQNTSTVYFSRAIYLAVDEIQVISTLNELIDKFADSVTFGSYPLRGDSRKSHALARISLESVTMANCLNAEELFISRIPASWIIYPEVEVPDFAFIRRLSMIETELSDVLNDSFRVRLNYRYTRG